MFTSLRNIAIALLLSATSAYGAFNSFNAASSLAQPNVTCDITTGIATGTGGGTCIASPATCDGAADDTSKFQTFATWAIAWETANPGLTVGLYLPSGKTCTLSTFTVPFAGIKNMIVLGTGATLSPGAGGGLWGGYHLAGDGQIASPDGSLAAALTNTVSAGATSVTLVTAAQTSRFPVGRYAMMLGLDVQVSGYPANNYYVNFVKITAVDGACNGTGTVCFDRALTDTFKSTWPLWNSGGSGDPNHGGPATLNVLPASWDINIEYRGLTFTNTVQSDANGRQVVFRNTTWTGTDVGGSCLFPSVNYSISIINSSMTNCTMEYDKLTDTVTFDTVTIDTINMQSSSGNNSLYIRNSTVATQLGTAKNNFFTDTTFSTSLYMGANQGYGYTREVICTRCVIGAIGNQVLEQGFQITNLGSMSGGVITIAGLQSWAVPGANLAWADDQQKRPFSQFFQITDVAQSGGNTLITTNWPGGVVPTIPSGGPGSSLRLMVHPALKFTCTACTGAGAIFNGATPASPLFSYAQYTNTGASGTADQTGANMWGEITQININATVAYGGVSAMTYTPGAAFPAVNVGTNAFYNYGPVINAKSVGNRQWTPGGGLTCPSGTCTGDSGVTPADTNTILFGTGYSHFNTDGSAQCPGAGCASVTTTITMDQGVVNP